MDKKIDSATRAEAEEALAVAIILQPKREKEFISSLEDWIVAFDFYKNHGVALSAIPSQLVGIDFTQGVTIKIIPPPDILIQFQPPTTRGEFPTAATGKYWSQGGVTPEQLGISVYGKMRDPSKPWQAAPNADNVKKTAWEFRADPLRPFEALCSRAAQVTDTWSRNAPVLCEAGGAQMFAPDGKTNLTLVPGQVPRQSVSSSKLFSEAQESTPKFAL